MANIVKAALKQNKCCAVALGMTNTFNSAILEALMKLGGPKDLSGHFKSIGAEGSKEPYVIPIRAMLKQK